MPPVTMNLNPVVNAQTGQVAAFDCITAAPESGPNSTSNQTDTDSPMSAPPVTNGTFDIVLNTLRLVCDSSTDVVVNLPVRVSSLMQAEFYGRIKDVTAQDWYKPNALQLAVSEYEMPLSPSIGEVLERYRQRQVRIAVANVISAGEDFQGFAANQVSTLRLAPAFAANMGHSSWLTDALKGYLRLAAIMEKDLVMTGIEKAEQFHQAVQLGIQYFQGPYLSEPVTQQHARTLLAENKSLVPDLVMS